VLTKDGWQDVRIEDGTGMAREDADPDPDAEAVVAKSDLVAEFRSLAIRLDSLDPDRLTPMELRAMEDLLQQLQDYYGH
jgi:hypothetical protein